MQSMKSFREASVVNVVSIGGVVSVGTVVECSQ